nr:NAD(P)H-dependent oxidoreductase [uncultured Carboxylicivirga sp.]
MKLAIFNGSPRKTKSNSSILIEHFLKGYAQYCIDDVPQFYLASPKDKREALDTFAKAENIIIIFPLYTDAMPGVVKEFFEDLGRIELLSDKNIGYIVQSGFPESIHSIYIERYLKKYTQRLKCNYIGTVLKGGVEGIQIMPERMTRKLFLNFKCLGEHFAMNNNFSHSIKEELQKPFKMSKVRQFIFSALSKTGITNFYWNKNLKKNNAFDKRFDRPYQL